MNVAQYAIVHTAQRGESSTKVENVWMVVLKQEQASLYQQQLQELARHDCPFSDIHRFELLPLRRGFLTEVHDQILQVH